MERKVVVFGEGMDKDTSPRFLPDGRCVDSLNIRYSNELGSAQDILGNKLFDNTGISALGDNACVGAMSEGDDIYYLIYNTLGHHSIWHYSRISGTHTKVLEDSILNFKGGVITGIKIVNGLLYWTDGYYNSLGLNSNNDLDYNPPRKLNVDKAKRYTISSGTDPLGYSVIDTHTLDLIKWPPKFSPTVVYDTDSTKKANQLYQNLYQFIYRNIYDDHEESAWSAISEMVLPSNHEGIDGRRYGSPEVDNVLKVTVDSGHETVRKIEVAVRKGNYGNFGVFKTLDKDLDGISNNVSHEVSFYGTEFIATVDNQSLINYHAVPQTAEDMELMSGNALGLANGYEGYDNEEVDLTVTPGYRIVDQTDLWKLNVIKVKKYSLTNGSYVQQNIGNEVRILIDPNDLPPLGTDLAMQLIRGQSDDPALDLYFYINYIITEADTLDGDDFRDNLYDFISDIYSPLYVENVLPGVFDPLWNPNSFGYVRIFKMANANVVENELVLPGQGGDPPLGGGQTEWRYLSGAYSVYDSEKYPCWKYGVNHPIGMVYYDRAQRDSGVSYNDSSDVYVPFPTELTLTSVGVTDNNPYYNILKWSVAHVPPLFATHYRFVYKGNDRILDFQQRTCVEAIYDGENRIKLSLDNFYEEEYKGAVINHQIQKGDVLRMLTKSKDSDFVNYDDNIEFFEEYIEFNVLEYIPNEGYQGGDVVVIERFEWEQYGLSLEARAFIVEIYTPKKDSEDALWFELSQQYNILDPHTDDRRHEGMLKTEILVLNIIGTDQIEVEGDFAYTELGAVITIAGASIPSNNGIFNILTSSYDVMNNKTLFTVDVPPNLTDEFTPTGVTATVKMNQVTTGGTPSPAQGYFEKGDVYYRRRLYSTGYHLAFEITNALYWVQDPHFSDYYTSNFYQRGRPQALDVNNRRELRSTLIRNSQKYLESTNINGLSDFRFLDQKQLQMDFGPVVRIVQVGYTLKCFQADKVTSIYIEKNIILNADGTEGLAVTNKVLGDVRPHEEPYGTTFPESVCKVDRDIYFYDGTRRCYINATPGGMFDISELGMRTWFNEKPDDYVGKDVRVVSVHDRRNSEVIITFTMSRSAFDYDGRISLGYNYVKKQWKGFYSFAGEMLVSCADDEVWSFNDGLLYQHDVGKVRTFYGTAYDASIQFSFNESPELTKILKSILLGVEGGVWDVEDVTIPATNNYILGMNSDINNKLFVNYEGNMSADFMRDKNDPEFVNPAIAHVDGRELRGNHALIRLRITGSPAKQKVLHHAIVKYLNSELMG